MFNHYDLRKLKERGQKMGTKIIAKYFTVIFIMLNLIGIASANELLIDRLIEKGVLSQDDAAGIRAEGAINAQEEAEKKRKFVVEGKSKIDLGGYIQAQYTNDESTMHEFKIRRARLDLRGSTPEVGWRLQLDAVQPLKNVVSSVSQDSTTKNTTTATTKVVTRPVILDAYLDYNLYPYANFRVGQFKIPFSRENLESSPNLDTINRSQVTEKLVPGRDTGSQGRDIGVQVGGILDSREGKKLFEYAVGVFNGAGINVSEDNDRKDLDVRVLVFPVQGLSIGVAHYTGKTGTSGDIDKVRTGAEAVYSINSLSLKGEYISGRDGSTDKYGWYMQMGYRFVSALEAVAKYDSFDPDKDKSGDRTDVVTLGLNWFINKSAKIQANYEWKTEEGSEIDNNVFLTQFQTQF